MSRFLRSEILIPINLQDILEDKTGAFRTGLNRLEFLEPNIPKSAVLPFAGASLYIAVYS